jgi:hypothetical protein
MAKQLKRMNYGGKTGVDNSTTNTTSGQKLNNYTKPTSTETTQGQTRNFKKGGTTTKTVTTLKKRK